MRTPLEAATDDHLAVAARAGCEVAFGLLYLRHRPDVLRYLRRHVGCRHSADDLVGDVFLRAFRGLDAYQGGNFIGWLMSIARHRVIDHYRLAANRREVPVQELVDLLGTEVVPAAEQVALDRLEADEVARRIQSALALLTADQRACLELRFLRGHDVAEAARELGKSPGAVRVLQHRAVQAMRGVLAPEHGDLVGSRS